MSSDLITVAKTLRKRSTDAENVLWRHLRSKRFSGLKFRRQQPIGNYIVDFVCFERRTVIEVDGGGHVFENVKDNERDQWLRGEGFTVLRFWNNEVLQNIDGVLEAISGYVLSPSP